MVRRAAKVTTCPICRPCGSTLPWVTIPNDVDLVLPANGKPGGYCCLPRRRHADEFSAVPAQAHHAAILCAPVDAVDASGEAASHAVAAVASLGCLSRLVRPHLRPSRLLRALRLPSGVAVCAVPAPPTPCDRAALPPLRYGGRHHTVVGDRRDELRDAERLREERRRAERLCAGSEVMSTGDEHDGNVVHGAVGELRTPEVIAAEVRHHEIEYDDAWPRLRAQQDQRG